MNERAVNFLASVITIANAAYAILAIGNFRYLSVPDYVELSATSGFFLFFIAQSLCSIFVSHAVVWYAGQRGQVLTASLFLGLLNVAITVFDYQFLFHVKSLGNFHAAVGFAICAALALLIDLLVMKELVVTQFSWAAKFDFAEDEYNQYMGIQTILYLASYIYFVFVAGGF
ncbi:MAG: hypothetical protein P4L72_16985 [Parvibaculum sp.]|uniref:hypothetical protein n=1 Tax=Parvibaculum sp. TaxID=2024848 RepID=UPI0028481840|nr:hypothetical protein [Parvibaculum sp.]MDR3500911.1 hypothetical protein [Parvibaculum sp.]